MNDIIKLPMADDPELIRKNNQLMEAANLPWFTSSPNILADVATATLSPRQESIDKGIKKAVEPMHWFDGE